jgi:hypothetical protein
VFVAKLIAVLEATNGSTPPSPAGLSGRSPLEALEPVDEDGADEVERQRGPRPTHPRHARVGGDADGAVQGAVERREQGGAPRPPPAERAVELRADGDSERAEEQRDAAELGEEVGVHDSRSGKSRA